MHTIVLNADYTYLNTVNWKRAVKLLILEKAEALKEAETDICTSGKVRTLKVPLVLRLVRLVKTVYNNKVPWSKRNVFIRDGYRCQYCGATDTLSLDHVLPQSRGGKTNFENCVTSCIPCNIKKDNRTPAEAHMRLFKEPYEPTIMEFLMHKMRSTGVFEFLKESGIY